MRDGAHGRSTNEPDGIYERLGYDSFNSSVVKKRTMYAMLECNFHIPARFATTNSCDI